ncbi:MAG: hypothetical protein NTV35_00265, partial [Chloroflexi bacterium]|nr:hypothetical protein [Chloroflexota bacterium]
DRADPAPGVKHDRAICLPGLYPTFRLTAIDPRLPQSSHRRRYQSSSTASSGSNTPTHVERDPLIDYLRTR